MKLIANTFYALFILLLIGVAGLFLATMLPIPGNIEVKIVKSGSMEPTIPTGSVVIVAPAASYAANDVVTFGKDTKAEIPTTHRILSVSGEGAAQMFVTKGDANEEQDPVPVPASAVIGKVWLHVPYMGYVLDFARKPWGFAFMIGIPAALIILDELVRIGREVGVMRRRKRDEADVIDAFQEPNREPAPRSGPHVARTARPFDIPRQTYD